ncbi:MAG: hypothetical protein WA862_03865 [Solirubrobacterales bacterium]
MKRIKNLSLAVVAALALTAMVGAASASASAKFTIMDGSYPIILHGTEAVGGFNLSTGPSEVVSCQLGSVSGVLTAASESLDGDLGSPKCSSLGSKPLNMNGCRFIFHSSSQFFDRTKGTFDIGPPGCGPITFQPYWCNATTSYPAQTGLAARYENVGGNKVIVRPEASNMEYTRTGNCGAGTYTNGSLSGGSWTLQSYDGKAVQVVQDPHTPEFEAESYPAAISGAQVGTSVLAGTWIKHECKQGTGSNVLISASTALPLSPTYSECRFNGVASTVTTNGCVFVNRVEGKVAPGKYSGSMDINCPAGKVIEITMNAVMPICSATIPPQSGLTGMTYENDTSSGHRVKLVSSLSGIKYTLTKHHLLCGANLAIGETVNYTNGTYSGTFLTESPDLRVDG